MNTNYNKISDRKQNPQDQQNSEELKNEIRQEAKPTESQQLNTLKRAIVCNCGQLNIRIEPSKDSKVVCIVNKGSNLAVGETIDGWVEVYNKQKTEIEGYVMEQYIKEV